MIENFSAEEIIANNKKYKERIELYKSYGYDVVKERRFILNTAEPLSGRILEAGTGRGHFTLEIAKKGYTLVTYDIDAEMQRIAKMKVFYAGLNDKVNFFIEEKEKLSFKDKSFDVIFCVNTLHHIEKPDIVFNEFLRILDDNGRIVLSDFTNKAFKILDRIHKNEGRTHEIKGWTLDEAYSYLKKSGCVIIKETEDDYQRIFIFKKEM